jgi:hypothetical protein
MPTSSGIQTRIPRVREVKTHALDCAATVIDCIDS